MKKQVHKQVAGQALLLVLVAVAVVLTIALSSVSRSVIDVSVTSREEDALRAFSAAEAGIEQVLIAGVGSGSLGNQSTFATETEPLAAGSTEYNLPVDSVSGDTMTIFFVGHNANGNIECGSGTCYSGNTIEVCWGDEGTQINNETPALEFSTYYDPNRTAITSGNYSAVRIFRATFDPNIARTNTGTQPNRFSPAVSCSSQIDGKTYAFSSGNITLPCSPGTPACLLHAKTRLFYNSNESHPLGVKVAGGTLPSQGERIESVGTSGSSTRKVEVYRTFSELPSVFESAIFSLPGVVQ